MRGQKRIRSHMHRQVRRSARFLAALVVTLLVPISTGGSATAAVTPPDFNALLSTRPYARLFSEATNCKDNRTVNELTGAALTARLAQLASWYVHMHGEASATLPLGSSCQG